MKKWFITGAKRVGYHHEKMEIKLPCQDYFTIKGNGNLFATALADGLGSASHSEEGAEIATKVCTKLLIKNSKKYFSLQSPAEMIDEILEEINRSISEVAQSKDNNINDYATTLMFALVYKDNFILGHLGDGAIGSVNINDETFVISTEEKEQEKNYTVSVTSKNANKSVRIFRGSLKDKIGFVLMSDGPYDVFIQNLPKGEKRMVSDVSDLFNLFRKDVNAFEKELSNYIEKEIYPNIYDDISLVFLLAQDIQSKYFDLNEEERNSLFVKPKSKKIFNEISEKFTIIEDVLNALNWPTPKKEFLESLQKKYEIETYEKIIDLLINEEFLLFNKDEIIELNPNKSNLVVKKDNNTLKKDSAEE